MECYARQHRGDELLLAGRPGRAGLELDRLVRGADQAGVDTVWVVDHLLQADPTAPPEDTEMLEAYTTLGFLAARTDRVRLGTMVSGVTFRPPALLVKAVTTLDVLSGGRAWLGSAPATTARRPRPWACRCPGPRAVRAAGGDPADRGPDVGRDDAPFEGRHYRLGGRWAARCPQRPRPPILIGGTGERKTLRLVAQYADACNLFDIPDGGRTVRTSSRSSPGTATTSAAPTTRSRRRSAPAWRPAESSDAFADRCAAAAALGIEHLVVLTSQPMDRRSAVHPGRRHHHSAVGRVARHLTVETGSSARPPAPPS